MSLNPTALQTSLAALFSGAFVFAGETVGRWPIDRIEAAKAWAKCYSDYAAGAISCQTVGPDSLTAAIALLESALAVAFDTTDPASCAAAIATALTVFWLTPPIVFTGTTAGAVTAVAGTAALQAALIANWISNIANSITAVDAAAQHSGVLDTFTKTVVVTHITPSVCAAPLT